MVASEIGKLAHATSKTVDKIQGTISEVNAAVKSLIDGSTSLLDFVQNTVTPDYNNFIVVANQYGNDAKSMEETSVKISEMAATIKSIMNEVSDAIQNITESSQTTADNSGKTMNSVNEVSRVVVNVSEMAQDHKKVSNNLNELVNKFKL